MRLGRLAAAFVIIAGQALAAELPLLPGIRAIDRRIVVDPGRPPWSAIVKVQTNIGTRCTGALIGPAIVLTAAHCLWNGRTRAFLQPVSLHVLVGYQRGVFRWHRLVAHYAVGPAEGPGMPPPPTADWARLELAEPVPSAVTPLPLDEGAPTPGQAVALAGYNQDRAQVLMADPDCRIEGVSQQAGATLLFHDCSATRGTSGGPLLTRHGKGWAVLGINIGAGSAANVALAVPR